MFVYGPGHHLCVERFTMFMCGTGQCLCVGRALTASPTRPNYNLPNLKERLSLGPYRSF